MKRAILGMPDEQPTWSVRTPQAGIARSLSLPPAVCLSPPIVVNLKVQDCRYRKRGPGYATHPALCPATLIAPCGGTVGQVLLMPFNGRAQINVKNVFNYLISVETMN